MLFEGKSMQRWTGEKRPAELLLLRPNPFPPYPSFSLPNSRATLLDPPSRQQHAETNEIIGWKSKERKENRGEYRCPVAKWKRQSGRS